MTQVPPCEQHHPPPPLQSGMMPPHDVEHVPLVQACPVGQSLAWLQPHVLLMMPVHACPALEPLQSPLLLHPHVVLPLLLH